ARALRRPPRRARALPRPARRPLPLRVRGDARRRARGRGLDVARVRRRDEPAPGARAGVARGGDQGRRVGAVVAGAVVAGAVVVGAGAPEVSAFPWSVAFAFFALAFSFGGPTRTSLGEAR